MQIEFDILNKKKLYIFQIFNLGSWKDCSIFFIPMTICLIGIKFQIFVIKSTGKMKKKILFLNTSHYDFILSILYCELKFVYSPLNDLWSIVESRGISFALRATWSASINHVFVCTESRRISGREKE